MASYDDEPKIACSNCKGLFPSSKAPLHEAYCSRNIRKCADCAMFVDKNEIEEHRSEFHTKHACEKCGVSVSNIEALSKHMNSECRMRPRTCNYCNVKIPSQEFESHQQACGSRTKLCGLCQKNILLRDYENHMDTCLGPPESTAQTSQQQQHQPHKRPSIPTTQASTAAADIARLRQPQSQQQQQQPLSTTSKPTVLPNSINDPYKLIQRDIPASEQRRPQSKQGLPQAQQPQQQYSQVIPDSIPANSRPSISKPTSTTTGASQQITQNPSNQSSSRQTGNQVPISAASINPTSVSNSNNKVPSSVNPRPSLANNGSSSSSGTSATQLQQQKEQARLQEQNELPTQGYYDNLQTKKFSNYDRQELSRQLSQQTTASTVQGASVNSQPASRSQANSNPNSYQPTNPNRMGPNYTSASNSQVPAGSSAAFGAQSRAQNNQPAIGNMNAVGMQQGKPGIGMGIGLSAGGGMLSGNNSNVYSTPSSASTNSSYRPNSRGGAIQAASGLALNNIPSSKLINQRGAGGFEDVDADLSRAIEESLRKDQFRRQPTGGNNNSSSSKNNHGAYEDELQKAINNSKRYK